MNDTTPSSDAPGGSNPTGGPQGPSEGRSSDRFFAWFRGLGIVRGNDRWFAGVAGGIAAKAGIDPLIVRGIFVVLALLGGPGILLYLAGWLLLPDSTGRIHLEEVMRGRASAGVIVTVVILGALVVIPLVFRVLPAALLMPWSWDVWGAVPGLGWVGTTLTVIWYAVLLPALVIWFIVWLSRRGSRASNTGRASHTGAGTAHQGEQRQHGGPPNQGSAGSAGWGDRTSAFADDVSRGAADFASKAETAAGQFGEKATEWGEQATAWGEKVGRDASEWARSERAYHHAHRLGAAHTVLTLALALLAAGAAAGWALSLSVSSELVLTAGLLGAVGVLAISLIIAGIRGRQSGWVGFLSFVGVLALIFAPFTSLLPDQTRFVPFGTATLTAEEHEPDNAIVMVAGNTTVDLTRLTEDADTREIEVWVLAGNNTIELPRTHPVRVQASVLAGNIMSDPADASTRDDDISRQSGLFLDHRAGSNLAGASESEVTSVRVRVMFGRVHIEGVGDLASGPAQQHTVGQKRIPADRHSLELETI